MTAFTGIPTPEQIGAIVGSLEAVVADPAKLATKENISTVIDEVKAVLKPSEAKNVPEEVEAFRKAFDRLLKDAGVKQLVVLIDHPLIVACPTPPSRHSKPSVSLFSLRGRHSSLRPTRQ